MDLPEVRGRVGSVHAAMREPVVPWWCHNRDSHRQRDAVSAHQHLHNDERHLLCGLRPVRQTGDTIKRLTVRHDGSCECGLRDTLHVLCSCADRAIANARRDGRIEGFEIGWNRGVEWCVANPTDIADIARGQCEEAVDDEWPEDKPNE